MLKTYPNYCKTAQIFALVPIIAVMFTFSFGTAFAAEPKTYDDAEFARALTAEMQNQITNMETAKTQLLAAVTYDEDGFAKFAGYDLDVMKAAIEAGCDDVISGMTDAMELEIRDIMDGIEAGDGFPTDIDPNAVKANLLSVEYANAYVADVTAWIGMAEAIMDTDEAPWTVIWKTQAPLTKALYSGKIAAVDTSKYEAKKVGTNKIGKDFVTDAEYVAYLMEEAQKALDKEEAKTVKTGYTYADKCANYKTIYTDFENEVKLVKTLEDAALEDGENAKDAAAAVNDYLYYGINYAYDSYKFELDDTYPVDIDVHDLKTDLLDKFDSFYTAATSKDNAKVFGVEVANLNKVTKAEAVAINNAFYDAITKSADVVKVYGGTDASKIYSLYNYSDSHCETFLGTLDKAMKVADVYANVVELGEKYKKTYDYGFKVYNDANVDAAVKEAESLVYADLGAKTFKSAEAYLAAAALELDITLTNDRYEYDKFLTAIADAKAKFTKSVSYGANKTPEADLVYCYDQYADVDAYNEIKDDAFAALDNAESYADIDAAMSDAAAELGKLLKAADKTDVNNAIKKYQAALDEYTKEQIKLADATKYAAATFNAAALQGKDLIAEATTVDAVKAAYEEAKALVSGVKSNDELKAMKEALIKQINALPYTSSIKAADKDTIVAAYNAYVEYIQTPGTKATEITNKAVLSGALDAVLKAEAKELNEKVTALQKELKKVDGGSDADLAAYVALKAQVEELVAAADAHNDFIDEVKEDANFTIKAPVDASALANTLGAVNADKAGSFWAKEVELVNVALVKAAKDGASVEDMKAALDAYKALTERQTYKVDAKVLALVKVVENKIGDAVESLKIKASSKATKGAITVSWKVTGDAAAADGYQLYKSTKAQKGYKKCITTTKTSFKNTKNLKKGTRYYYKVRAYVVVDGVTYYSDWSNKANRIAK